MAVPSFEGAGLTSLFALELKRTASRHFEAAALLDLILDDDVAVAIVGARCLWLREPPAD